MTLIRWEPVAELNTLQNEMNRLFNTFFDQPTPSGRGAVGDRRWVPAMDLIETGDHYVLRADLPGLSEADVNIHLQDDTLTISGQRKAEHESQKGSYYRLERAFGAFSRSLTLPAGVDPDAVQAHFDRGVLEVTIPKPEQKKPRQVQIKVGAQAAQQPESIEATHTPQSIQTSHAPESIESGDPQSNSRDPAPALA